MGTQKKKYDESQRSRWERKRSSIMNPRDLAGNAEEEEEVW